MENSCRKKYKPFPKKWILASRCTGFRRNSALIPANAGLFHYAGNCPVRYIDPTGAFDWSTNTIEDGDTLSQIAEDCYTKYGVNYTADDLQNLNKDTISDKHKIYAGTRLNLGKVEDVQKRAADYQNRATTRYSNYQFKDISQNSNSGYYSKKTNFFLGFGEFVSGIGIIVGGCFAAAAVAPETMGSGSAMIGYDSVLIGSAIFSYGITRMTGGNNKPFGEDIKNILVPPMAAFMDIDSRDIK